VEKNQGGEEGALPLEQYRRPSFEKAKEWEKEYGGDAGCTGSLGISIRNRTGRKN